MFHENWDEFTRYLRQPKEKKLKNVTLKPKKSTLKKIKPRKSKITKTLLKSQIGKSKIKTGPKPKINKLATKIKIDKRK